MNILIFFEIPMLFNKNWAVKLLARAALENLESSLHHSSIEMLVRILVKALDVEVFLYFHRLTLVEIESVDYIVIESLL